MRNLKLFNKFISLKKQFHCSRKLLGNGENVKKKLFLQVRKEKAKRRTRVTVIGASGHVGSYLSYTLFQQNVCSEILMYDIPEAKNKVCGHALDILHGRAIVRSPNVKICTDLAATAGSNIIVICSSVGGSEPDVSPLDVCQDNICCFAKMIPELAKHSPECVFLVMSNPVDILTYAAHKYSGFDKNSVIGSGTLLDTSRFRYHIGKRMGVHPRSVKAYIIGEHGDSSVAIWSGVNIAGTRLRDIDSAIGTDCDENNWKGIHKKTIKDRLTVTKLKGWSDFGAAICGSDLIHSIIKDTRKVYTVSTYANGIHGLHCCSFLSLPCVIGNRGVTHVVQQCLEESELEMLERSACILDEQVKKMKWP